MCHFTKEWNIGDGNSSIEWKKKNMDEDAKKDKCKATSIHGKLCEIKKNNVVQLKDI